MKQKLPMAHVTPSRSTTWLAGLFFSLIGIGLLAIAFHLFTERQDFLSRAQRADGVVSALNAGGSHPQVSFDTATGERFSYAQGGFIHGYEVGQPVQVLYLPERAQASAVVEDRGALWGLPVALALMGLTFALGGVLYLFRPRRAERMLFLKGR